MAWKANSKEKAALNFSQTMEKDVRMLNKEVLYFVSNPTELKTVDALNHQLFKLATVGDQKTEVSHFRQSTIDPFDVSNANFFKGENHSRIRQQYPADSAYAYSTNIRKSESTGRMCFNVEQYFIMNTKFRSRTLVSD